jgi:hypothetical protein
MIVADSGPLITFARANKLELLRKVIGTLSIPEAVYDEIVVGGEGKPGAHEIATSSWIEVKKIHDKRKLCALSEKLGAGEKEAIALVEEVNGVLLIDDPRARIEAKERRIKLISSPDILQEAKNRNLIPSVGDALDDLTRGGFRISDRLRQDILKRAGETF